MALPSQYTLASQELSGLQRFLSKAGKTVYPKVLMAGESPSTGPPSAELENAGTSLVIAIRSKAQEYSHGRRVVILHSIKIFPYQEHSTFLISYQSSFKDPKVSWAGFSPAS